MPSIAFERAAAVFEPAEVASMSEAFLIALSSIAEETFKVEFPGHELRRRLALRIIEEARRAPSDPHRVAERALAGLSP